MKKNIVLLFALSGLVWKAAAQSSDPTTVISESDNLKKLRFGVYVAPTLSMMRPSAEKDGDQTQANGGNKLGFTYGLMADYNFTDNYAIATGLQVNSTGGIITTENLKTTNGVSKSNIDYSLQFLEVPVALKLRTDMVGKFRFFGQAGLSVGFNISKKYTYQVTEKKTGLPDTTYATTEKEKITGGIGAIAPVMFQMNVGIGAQYAIGSKLDAYFGVFFNNGFAPNITIPEKFDNLPDFKDGNTRLNNFALRLGFFF